MLTITITDCTEPPLGQFKTLFSSQRGSGHSTQPAGGGQRGPQPLLQSSKPLQPAQFARLSKQLSQSTQQILRAKTVPAGVALSGVQVGGLGSVGLGINYFAIELTGAQIGTPGGLL